MKHHSCVAFAATLALWSLQAVAEEKSKDPINDYIVNVGPGHIAANELIGLTGSAVSNLQTPKDLVAALAGLGDSSSKTGFGLAWSPGRSSNQLLGVSATDYAGLGANPLSRFWASTTFSYAQNTKTINNANYGQRAAAVNVVYYLKASDDPLAAQYLAFFGMSDPTGKAGCTKESEAFDAAAKAITVSLNQRILDRQKALKGPVPLAEQEAIKQEYAREVEQKKANPVQLARRAKSEMNATPVAMRGELEAQVKALDECARAANKKAADKWNASHLDLVLGQAWIRGEASATPRISLGRHVAVALAWELPNAMLNLTYRRVSGELDLDTLTLAPIYKGSSIAAARYTYRMDDRPGKQAYALAEVSNAKANSGTTSSAAFKWALGIDHQLGKNAWIEFRAGRARVPGGKTEENKALFSFKLAPAAGLPNAIKASDS